MYVNLTEQEIKVIRTVFEVAIASDDDIGQLSSTLHLDPEETGEIVDGLNEKLEEALVEGG